jgi:hypothetical protein
LFYILIGIALADLTFIEGGSRPIVDVDPTGEIIIDFLKCRMNTTTIQGLLKFQKHLYSFERMDIIFDYIKNIGVAEQLHLSEFHDWSVKVEPRRWS